MYAARLKRPTPYVDKTVYVGWNSLCVSAYLEAAKVLKLDRARHFALRSLDRVLAEAWQPEQGLQHVVAYSDPAAERRVGARPARRLRLHRGRLPRCLRGHRRPQLLQLRAAHRGQDGRPFSSIPSPADSSTLPAWRMEQKPLGVLGTRRKPFQDSPTPAGNSVAAIALLRLHAFTNQQSYRDKAEQTLELLAGLAGKFGIFAATYGIAAVISHSPHTQVVVIGEDDLAEQLDAIAAGFFALRQAVLKLAANKAVAQNLPPALAETIPQLPGDQGGKVSGGGLLRIQLPASDHGSGATAAQTSAALDEELSDETAPTKLIESGDRGQKKGLTVRFAIGQPGQGQSHLRG